MVLCIFINFHFVQVFLILRLCWGDASRFSDFSFFYYPIFRIFLNFYLKIFNYRLIEFFFSDHIRIRNGFSYCFYVFQCRVIFWPCSMSWTSLQNLSFTFRNSRIFRFLFIQIYFIRFLWIFTDLFINSFICSRFSCSTIVSSSFNLGELFDIFIISLSLAQCRLSAHRRFYVSNGWISVSFDKNLLLFWIFI